MNTQFARITDPGGFKPFEMNKYVQGTKDFLQSNSIIAKFAFLLLVFVVFVMLLRLGTTLLGWLLTPSSNPTLLNGMIDSRQMMRISQNPSVNGSIPIIRSQNDREGLVFTWSVWIFIEDLVYRQNEFKHIFHKGNDNINMTTEPIGMNQPNNAPGLYIAPGTNDLVVVMNTFEKINEEVVVKDIPLNKWVNIIIRVNEQKHLDVYINGRLVRRHVLSGVPKQNYGDVFLSLNGGFSGYTSSLRYFANAIGTSKIQEIVDAGPNLKLVDGSSQLTTAKPRYLSLRWFFSGANDMYNP
jgi:hypothetical protein